MAPQRATQRWAARLKLALRIYCQLGLCQVAVRLLLSFLRRCRSARILRDVPNMKVPMHPILGGLPALLQNRKRLHHWRKEATEGLPMAKWMGPVWDDDSVIVGVQDPANIKHFLKDSFDKYTKSEPRRDWVWKHLTEFLGNGIFTAKHGSGAEDGGQLWMQQRKVAANIFSRSNFNNNMHSVFVAKAKRLRSLLVPGQRVDMQQHFFNFTMDSIMRIFFGEDSDTMGGDVNVYGQAFDSAHRAFFEHSVETLPIMSMGRFFPWPFGGYSGLIALLVQQCSSTYRRFSRSCAVLSSEGSKIIARCRADPTLDQRTDLLALFMQAAAKEGLPEGKSTEYLKDMVQNFVIAGRDTTACTLAWMFYILGTHPEIQRRVQEEIDEKLPEGTVPTFKLLHHSNMPLLHALLYETFRLYPAVPFDGKEAQCDDVFPDGTRIPKYAKVWFVPWTMGRNAHVYPDPEEVRLERWLPFKQPQPHEFPVFQAGPRICLGMDMAIFEAKLLASMLLQDFTFTLAEGEAEKIHYSHMLTMSVCNSHEQDSHNLWLVPQRRERAPPPGAAP